MKSVVTAAIALFASAGAVLAADMGPVIVPGPLAPSPAYPKGPVVIPGPLDPPPAYPLIKVYDWTGFYLGINGGGTFGNMSWFSVPDLVGGSANLSGGLIGGTAGYNLQAGDPVVVGVEADLDWSGWSGAKTTITPASCAPGCTFSDPWLSTVRLRLGYAFNAIMPYVTGGAAIGRLNADIIGAPFGNGGQTNVGWTLGAGVEFVVWGDFRAKVEYLHVDLNGFSCNTACGGGPITFNVRDDNIIRAGLNYRLWN